MQALIIKLLDDGQRAQLIEPFEVEALGHWIRVPSGFITDFASVPRLFWRLIPPWGKYARAAVVHDWLYCSHELSRKESDRVFEHLMKELGVGWLKRKTMYRAVRAAGWLPWRKGGKA